MSADIITEGYEEIGLYLGCPVPDLEALYLLDTSVGKASRNFAPRRPGGACVGDLVFEASTPPQFDGLVKYVQTSTGETAEHTIFSVVLFEDTGVDDAHRPMFYGTFRSQAAAGGGLTFGQSLYIIGGANNLTLAATRGTDVSNDTAVGTAIVGFPSGSYALIADRVSATKSELFNLTSGISNSANFATPRFLSTGKYRIGSGSEQFGGLCRVASWWKFPRALSNGEMDLMAAVVREREARWGRIV